MRASLLPHTHTNTYTHTPDLERLLQYAVALLYSTEAASKVPDLIAKAKREFDKSAIDGQVRREGEGAPC
jgi:hypothetical protein